MTIGSVCWKSCCVLIAITFLFAACSKTKGDKPSGPITCEQGISSAIRERYLPKARAFTSALAKAGEADPTNLKADTKTSCEFIRDDVPPSDPRPDMAQRKVALGMVSVGFACGPSAEDVDGYLAGVRQYEIDVLKVTPTESTSVSGVGRRAFRTNTSFTVLHRSLPCTISGSGALEPSTLQAFATDLEASLP